MPYIVYSKEHGPIALIEAPIHTATLSGAEIAIPCESGADVNDRERWEEEAAIMIANGYIAPTLELAQELKRDELRLARDSCIADGFQYGDYVFPITDDVKGLLMLEFMGSQVMPAPYYEWKDIGDVYRPIGDAAAFQTFCMAALGYGKGFYAREGMLQVLVNEAESIEEVMAITWDTVPGESV